jgi:hypothetical protein
MIGPGACAIKQPQSNLQRNNWSDCHCRSPPPLSENLLAMPEPTRLDSSHSDGRALQGPNFKYPLRAISSFQLAHCEVENLDISKEKYLVLVGDEHNFIKENVIFYRDKDND